MESCRKFKLIQALIVVLIVYKNEVDPIKIESTEWSQHSPIISLWGFFQTLKVRLLISPWLDPAEFRTHPRYYGLTCCLQE